MKIDKTHEVDKTYMYENSSRCLWLDMYELPWEDSEDHLLKLQEKINTYVYYIESKAYQKRYPAPEFNFDIFVIVICFFYKPTTEVVDLLAQVSGFLREKNKDDKSKRIMVLSDLTTMD